MGSYCNLKLGNVEIGWNKNDYDPYLLSLFQESDKKIIPSTIKEYYRSEDFSEDEQEESITIVQYRSTVYAIRDRLELMGYTREVAEKGFYKGLEIEIEQYKEWSSNQDVDVFKTTLEVLQNLDLEKWWHAIREINENNLNATHLYDKNITLSSVVKYILENGWYGFPGYDYRHFIRLLIDTFDEEDELIYDFTDLALGGWVDEADELVELLENEVSANYSAERRVIIATEGRTDAVFLKRSLELLYPHISDFYRFLDFEEAKVPGGAGALASMIKAFAGAGIINRVIALFDNDTAADSAIRPLKMVDLPENIEILKYPKLDLALNYPTIGPSGLVSMDVNSLAGSIELYLGKDCLIDESGNLIPIQWKGYDSKLKKYQGEIMNKGDIQERFLEKLEKCESSHELIDHYDWSGIHLIINSLMSAFHDKDEKAILSNQELI